MADTGLIGGGWSLTLAWQTVAAAAQLSPPVLLSDGGSQVTLQAQAGQTYAIEASTDLLTWMPIATNTLSGTTWIFEDTKSTNYSRRFYRAVYRP